MTRRTRTAILKTTFADSVEVALAVVKSNAVVTVPEAVWLAVKAQESSQGLMHEGRFLLLRGEGAHQKVIWCDNPQRYSLDKRTWISSSLVAGYMNEFKLYCLLQLQAEDHVVPSPKGILKPHELGELNRLLNRQAWETPTWERDRCFPSFPPTAS